MDEKQKKDDLLQDGLEDNLEDVISSAEEASNKNIIQKRKKRRGYPVSSIFLITLLFIIFLFSTVYNISTISVLNAKANREEKINSIENGIYYIRGKIDLYMAKNGRFPKNLDEIHGSTYGLQYEFLNDSSFNLSYEDNEDTVLYNSVKDVFLKK